MYELGSDMDEKEEYNDSDSDVVKGVTGLSKREEAAVLALHNLFKQFLLATTETMDEDSKWSNTLECLMAISALHKDSTF